MDTSPLVTEEIEAGAAFVEQLHAYQPVTAACWLRESEDEERYLFVALDGLTVENTDAAYREVLRITRELKDHYIDPFRVKLISPADPVAKAVTEIHERYSGRVPPRFNGHVFGRDRKSTRLNSSHLGISYAVFC